MKGHLKKIIDEFNRKVEELEHRSKQQRGEEETDYQKELRFERLRQERAEYRKTRPNRHRWWFSYGDARLADTWFRECLYFPEDNPTEEERNFYQQILQEFVKKKIPYNFHLDSTKKGFWQWYHDEGMKDIDKQHFPLHNHGDHDFFHDQSEQQDYYYDPKIYGPKGDSQNFLWNIAFEEGDEHIENKKELEPYFAHQEQRRRQQRRPAEDHEF